jgi:hypothetical protein
MIAGTKITNNSQSKVLERIRTILAGANCEILDQSDESIRFRHGTYMTQTAPMLPKEGVLRLTGDGDSTRVDYEVQVSGFAKLWMTLVAVIFFWAVFPPILVYRALVYHPRQFMENILSGI